MEEEKPKKKRKKKAAEGDGEKEHRKNWREVNATPAEITSISLETVVVSSPVIVNCVGVVLIL